MRIYRTDEGGEPFLQWLRSMRDARGRGVVRSRLNRLRSGIFLNCKSIGAGVHELKINFGPGYRVYFGEDGNSIILLAGGDKDSQDRDIARAREHWRDYNA
ncbi:MAG: type II toxin-antitoxin system RelE/ParE family toxin [Bryobacteraceae bacterium]